MSRSLEFPAILGITGLAVGAALAIAVTTGQNETAPAEHAAAAAPASAPVKAPAPAVEAAAETAPEPPPQPAAPEVTQAAATPADPVALLPASHYGLGRAALPEEVSAWDVAVLPDGQGLRPGSGDVFTGEEVFAENCAMCHGDFAEGLDSWPSLAGGLGSLTDPRPVKTIGSYWPYLSTVYDYVHRSMPFGAAQTISVDDTYAITAFLLYSNGLVEDDFVLSDENFTEIVLPNADGFYPDDRPVTEYPLFTHEPCMTDCLPQVAVTKRAVELNVTPEDADGSPAGTLPDVNPGRSPAGATPAAAEATPAVVEAPAPAAPAGGADAALVAAGETVFKKCSACHKVGEGAKNGTGPALTGIVGSAAGHVEGFKYSKPLTTMAEGGLVWDQATLDAFLADPKAFMKGTKMSFAGLKNAEDRAAVIAYLESFGK